MKKVCFAASSGGHYEQLLMLKPLMETYDSFVVTEETDYKTAVPGQKMYYMKQVNRKELRCLPYMLVNFWRAFRICRKERPEFVISTGALATIPVCLVGKLFGSKLIFIESFAKVTSKTLTGSLLYHFADQFYVQWPQMQELYPKAIYLGGIY